MSVILQSLKSQERFEEILKVGPGSPNRRHAGQRLGSWDGANVGFRPLGGRCATRRLRLGGHDSWSVEVFHTIVW